MESNELDLKELKLKYCDIACPSENVVINDTNDWVEKIVRQNLPNQDKENLMRFGLKENHIILSDSSCSSDNEDEFSSSRFLKTDSGCRRWLLSKPNLESKNNDVKPNKPESLKNTNLLSSFSNDKNLNENSNLKLEKNNYLKQIDQQPSTWQLLDDSFTLPGPSGLNINQRRKNILNEPDCNEDVGYFSSDQFRSSYTGAFLPRFSISDLSCHREEKENSLEQSEDIDLGVVGLSDQIKKQECLIDEQLTVVNNGSKVQSKKLKVENSFQNHPHAISCRPISESPSIGHLSVESNVSTDPNAPMCKICHLNAKEMDLLITPCRCAGTMRYIHCGCLMRWLEISSKRSRKPLSCELCQYQYHWHKKFKVRHWQFPHCSRKDKLLHALFFLSIGVMITCAVMTIICFKHEREQRLDPNRTELTDSEIVTLICGVLFFLAFFMAMYVEVKAKITLCKLLLKFIYLNQQWYIDEYDKKDQSPVDI